MNFSWLVVLLALASQNAESKGTAGSKPGTDLTEWLNQLHLGDALEYTIYRDAGRKEKVELQREPVYIWTNPVRAQQQYGTVFVWTSRGRAEAIGCIFSAPSPGKRGVSHEFHSLSLSALDVSREGTHANTWTPQAPGIHLTPLEDAPAPAATPPKRLAQMRMLARDFSASSKDAKDNRWTLRLLPRPIYTYKSTDPDVLDGALFAFVSSAGTDPEVVLIVEARRPSGGGERRWNYGIARLSDLNLWVQHHGKDVYTAELIRGNTRLLYPRQEYRVFGDRAIPVGKDVAR